MGKFLSSIILPVAMFVSLFLTTACQTTDGSTALNQGNQAQASAKTFKLDGFYGEFTPLGQWNKPDETSGYSRLANWAKLDFTNKKDKSSLIFTAVERGNRSSNSVGEWADTVIPKRLTELVNQWGYDSSSKEGTQSSTLGSGHVATVITYKLVRKGNSRNVIFAHFAYGSGEDPDRYLVQAYNIKEDLTLGAFQKILRGFRLPKKPTK